MSLLDILVRGGWLMIPIALSSVVVIALGISRWLVLSKEKRELELFLGEWSVMAHSSNVERVISALEHGPESLAGIATGIKSGGSSPEELNRLMEMEARTALHSLEKGLGTLATLAAATPLIGFLGTVTGMIRAFMQIQNLGGNVNANVLAGGIWEALITTAAGLAVGILALVLHNYLATLISAVAQHLEQTGETILRLYKNSISTGFASSLSNPDSGYSDQNSPSSSLQSPPARYKR